MSTPIDAGIDWGMFGGSNRAIIDGKTYHYGVIPANDVLQAWVDSADMIYPEFDSSFYDWNDVCDVCGKMYAKHQKVKRHAFVNERAIESFNDLAEVSGWVLEDGDYSAFQDGDDSDIFITRSAYFTYSAFCSPCAPGAGYLRDARNSDNGIMSFCFAHDFFDDHIAPYGVWRVSDGSLVIPDNPHVSMLRYTDREDFAQWVKAWREFNANILAYALEYGGESMLRAVSSHIQMLEAAFEIGGYDAVMEVGTFDLANSSFRDMFDVLYEWNDVLGAWLARPGE